MRIRLMAILVTVVAGGEICVHAQTVVYKPGKKPALANPDVHPGSLWVKLKARHVGVLSATNGRAASLPGVTASRPLVPGSVTPSGRRGPVNQHIDISRYHTLSLEPGVSTEVAIASLMATGYFDVVEPVFRNHPLLSPNDPSFGAQAYLTLIKANEAWDITEGDEEIVIGIVDTGGDLSHPDLSDKIYINQLDPIDGLDNDGDGYTDNARGWDFSGDLAAQVGNPNFEGDNDPSVPKGGLFGHGTMVAGCAAASTNNGVGIASVGNRTSLLFTKHYADDQDANSTSYSSNTYLGVLYAATHGAKIINCSWGSYNPSTIAQDIINYVTLDLGCLVIAAAGNSNLESPIYPASYEHVLSVGSTTINDERTFFSNYGRTIDIVAPGDNLYTTQFKDAYVYESGTSLSTPIVSGAAALVWALHPGFTPLQVAEQLRVSADASIYAKNPSFLYKLGYGRLDVLAALTKESPSVRVSKEQFVNSSDAAPAAGDVARLVLDFTNYLAPASGALSATISTTSPYASVQQSTYAIGALGTGETRRNSTNPFTLTLSPALPLDEVVEILVTITDGTYEDHQWLNFSIASYLEIRENNIITSLSANGRIGYGAPDTQSNGAGFLYNEERLLYEMGLVVGTSSADLQNNVRAVGGNFDADFLPLSNMKKDTPGQRSYSEVSGSLKSADEALDIGYRSLVWNENPDRNFIVLEYTVTNQTTAPISDLYFGLFADWDIADQGAHDRAAWDPLTRLGYVFPAVGAQLPRTGIQVLTGQPQYRAIDNDHTIPGNPFGLYDGFTDDEKFTSVSGGIARTSAGLLPNGGDVSHTVGSGPYTINAGETITVAFALHAAMSQEELITSAKRADTLYNYTLRAPLPAIGITKVCEGARAELKPTGAGNFRLYRTFTGGEPVTSGPSLTLASINRDTVVYIENADESYGSLRVPATISVVLPPAINALGPLTFCQGGSVTLDAGPGDEYRWSTGELLQTITARSAGTYSVEVKREGIFCPSANSVTVVTRSLPDATFSTLPEVPVAGEAITFTASETNAAAWDWQVRDGESGTGQQFVYTFPDEGIYEVTLTVTDENLCSSTSSLEVGLITGIETRSSSTALYPNPVGDDHVQLRLPSRGAKLEVFDSMGRRLMVTEASGEEFLTFNVSSLLNGHYMLRITSDGHVVTHKFLVQR